MVSSFCLLAAAGLAAQFTPLAQRVSPSASSFRADANTGQLALPDPVRPNSEAITAEMRGDILMARKMYREAIEKYREITPATAILYNKIGIAYHQMLDLKAARQYYERAVLLNPKYAEAINNIGTVYYGKKNYGHAIKLYKQALKLSPQSASIYSNLGTGYFARRKYKDAVAAYEQAMALDPYVFDHHNTYGVLLQERAVDDLAKFHFYLAKVYAERGLKDQALVYIRKCLEEGFKDKKRFDEDPEFSVLHKLPEFQQLMALTPRVL